jgi:hypothetical protein
MPFRQAAFGGQPDSVFDPLAFETLMDLGLAKPAGGEVIFPLRQTPSP